MSLELTSKEAAGFLQAAIHELVVERVITRRTVREPSTIRVEEFCGNPCVTAEYRSQNGVRQGGASIAFTERELSQVDDWRVLLPKFKKLACMLSELAVEIRTKEGAA